MEREGLGGVGAWEVARLGGQMSTYRLYSTTGDSQLSPASPLAFNATWKYKASEHLHAHLRLSLGLSVG